MIIYEDTFVYEDFRNKLVDTEVKMMLELFKYMTEDNLLYLYQKVSQRNKSKIIEQVADNLCISEKTVQNRISSVIRKQDEMRYFMYGTKSKIKGEYFINPNLVLKNEEAYDVIYRSVIPKLEIEAIKENRNDSE
jgi:hypothetical protein